jgi:DNA-binding NtrC family response regulator
MKALIVDNAESFRTETARQLKRQGIETVTQANFLDGAAAFRSGGIGVVVTELLDVHGTMPLDDYLTILRNPRGTGYVPLIARSHIDDAARQLSGFGHIDVLISKSYAQRDEAVVQKVVQLLQEPMAYRSRPLILEPPRRVAEQPLGVRIPYDHYGTTKQPRRLASVRDIR